MARSSAAKRIRITQHGLIDEEGQRWDRIRSGHYYLTPDSCGRWRSRNRTDLGPAHAARLAAQEAAKYEPYGEPHHLDNVHDPAPVSRRRPEPISTFSPPPGAGPGIGF